MSEIRVTAKQKKVIAERANGCCEYCRSQARFAIQPFSCESPETRFLEQYLRQFLKSLTGYKPEATRTKPTSVGWNPYSPRRWALFV